MSHLGNIEISRALLDDAQRARIKILVHTVHAENFARVLRASSGLTRWPSTIQVTEMNPGTMFVLKEAIERGDWVALSRAIARLFAARSASAWRHFSAMTRRFPKVRISSRTCLSALCT